MPEGLAGYARWQGELARGPMFPVVMSREVRRAWKNVWSFYALILVFAYTIVFVGGLYTAGQTRGSTVHTMDTFLDFLNLVRWGSLAVAAVMAGPALLEDARRGALELYLARAVSRGEYLLGKILAVFGMAFAALAAPGIVYWVASFFLFDEHPKGWLLAPGGIVLYSAMWAVLVAGLGMGLSSVARSSRGATLALFGGLAVVDVLLANLLQAITRAPEAQILSPFSAVAQQAGWIFGATPPFGFPEWWGLAHWAALALVGWGLVAWKHPRIPGEERGGR